MSDQTPHHKAGGRPPAQPAPMTLLEWKAAGCPPLELSVMQVAEWAGISRARTNEHVKKGNLYRDDSKKKIPTNHPKNKPWLLDRDGYVRNELQAPGRPPGSPSPLRAPSIFDPPAPPPPAAPADGAGGSDMLDLDVVLDAISRMDLTALPSAAVQKVQRLESALKTRVEREAKRGQLIERSLVQTVMGRLYQIDADQLKPLGAKLAPDLGGEFGVEDVATLLRIEQRIDQEMHRILAHIKRLIDDFLAGVGAEPL